MLFSYNILVINMLLLVILELIYLISYLFILMNQHNVEIISKKIIFYKKYKYFRIRYFIFNALYILEILFITVLTIIKYLAII